MAEIATPKNRIGRYELLTRLATGGMAELFLAHERGLAGLERLVVIKRILPHLADQQSFVDMFLREARIIARLSHPNVVQIYELGQESNTYHIAMEYIHGSTVREALLLAQKKEKIVPLDVVLSIVEQACQGLHAAHELRDLDGKPLGLVHRDISPHNLMCTSDGYIKLLDFGVAKSTSASVEATYSGNLKGKFAYLSPEQCLHEPLDRRSDVFAMGIVMWEMCTMRRLFKRKTELQMMQAVIGGTVPPPSRFREDIPASIQEVVLKALATDRDERFASAEEMRTALIEGAKESGLALGENRVAAFLEEVAGERLKERRDTVASAFERALTAAERRRLLHLTGSNSRSEIADDLEDGGPTVVQRPGGRSGESTLHTPVSELNELIGRDRKGGKKTGLRKRRVALGALVTLLIGGIVIFAFSMTESEEAEVVEVVEIVVSGEPLPLGWAPTVDPDVLKEEVEPLHKFLEATTGRPVPLVMTKDYAELSQKLRSGELAVAVLPPLLLVETARRDEEIDVLAIKEFDGSTSSDALLLVRNERQIRNFEDLEGKTFCFVDPMSTSGNFLPRQYMRDQGHEPDEFIGDIHWSGDHFQGMRDLIDNKCDAAAVYSGAFLSGDEFGIRTGQIRTLAITGFIPQDSVAAGRHVSKEDRKMLREALLGFNPMDELGVERLGRNQRITGFSPGDASSFDFLRDILEREQVVFEDF